RVVGCGAATGRTLAFGRPEGRREAAVRIAQEPADLGPVLAALSAGSVWILRSATIPHFGGHPAQASRFCDGVARQPVEGRVEIRDRVACGCSSRGSELA